MLVPREGFDPPDARVFNAPLYLLSYLGKLIWRLVRESNPRLPTRQAGTQAAELTRRSSIRSRVPAPPNLCGRFTPSKCELDEGFCVAGIAYGTRTRVPTLKKWCPRPSRRTRVNGGQEPRLFAGEVAVLILS